MSQPEPVPQKVRRKKTGRIAEVDRIWVSERRSQFAAALASYPILSFVPLIHMAFTITEFVVARQSVEERFMPSRLAA